MCFPPLPGQGGSSLPSQAGRLSCSDGPSPPAHLGPCPGLPESAEPCSQPASPPDGVLMSWGHTCLLPPPWRVSPSVLACRDGSLVFCLPSFFPYILPSLPFSHPFFLSMLFPQRRASELHPHLSTICLGVSGLRVCLS